MSAKILLCPAVSLDGFIATPTGDSSWVTPQDEQLFVEAVAEAGCVIVGATTFKQFAGQIYPIEGAMNFVCTGNQPIEAAARCDNVEFLGGDVHSICQQICAAGFARAVLSGGGDTNGRFAAANAIEEILISIYPHAFGQGISLFGKWQGKLSLQLIETARLAGGVVRHRYSVIR